jgi:Major Facilitator Superfamily
MRSRAFRGLWFATGAANLGDGMTLFLLPLAALAVGASPAGVAAVTTVATLAWPVAGLLAGWLVDRADARRLLIGANLVRAFAVGVGALAFALDQLPMLGVLVIAAAYGVAETVVDTTLTSAVPALVPTSQRTAANARIEATINATNVLIGPPLAGFLAGLGLTHALGGAALSYAAAIGGALLIGSLSRRTRARAVSAASAADRPMRDEEQLVDAGDGRAWAGLIFVWRHPLLRSITLITAGMNVVWAAWAAIFVLYAVEPAYLDLSAGAYGLVLTAMAIGGLAASGLVGAAQRRLGAWNVMIADCLGTVLLVAPAALNLGVAPTVVGLVVAGAGSSVWRVLVATLRQNLTPAPMLGRVYAGSRMVSWGALPVGAALAGVLAEVTSVRATFGAFTVVALVVLAVFVLTVSRHTVEQALAEPEARTRPAAELSA